MITDGLLSYIQTQLEKDTPLDLIRSHLTQAGWLTADIEQGFNTIAAIFDRQEQQRKRDLEASIQAQERTQEVAVEQPTVARGPDLYREVLEPTSPTAKPGVIKTPLSSSVTTEKTEPQVWMAKTQPSPVVIQKPVASPSVVNQAAPPEASAAMPLKSVETPKIQPSVLPVSSQDNLLQQQINDLSKDMQSPTVAAVKSIPVTPAPVAAPQIGLSAAAPSAVTLANTAIKKIETTVAVTAPVKPLPPITSPVVAKAAATVAHVPQPTPLAPLLTLKKSAEDIVPHDAMIYSYADDISSVSKYPQVAAALKTPKRKIKWGVVVLISGIVLTGAGVVFAFVGGYIKLPTFVRKDPPNVVFSATIQFDSLKSYKTETTATLTMPSIANITAGLVSGHVVQSKDTESIEVSALGRVTNKNGATPMMVDYNTTIKSSFLKNDIVSSIQYDGSSLYVLVPALDQILGAYAPQSTTVTIPNGKLSMFVAELPQEVQDIIKKVDVHDVLTNGVPDATKDQMQNALVDFIKKINVTQVADETIKGVPTHHYQITADHQTTKDLIAKLAASFTGKLTSEQQNYVDTLVGAISVDSLDLWVGTGDNAIHQYEVNLTTPLSSVLALNDSGIAGNQVSLSWKRTYYDFDIANNIQIPANTVLIPDFIKTIRDAKIKAIVASFGSIARGLANAEGHFGKVPNANGSCTAPASSSLYSPTGHINGAIGPVALIAALMQNVLGISNNAGSCYSTPTAWAFAIPLASNPQSNFCADNTAH